MAKQEFTKIKFLKSPTGRFNLAYNAGQAGMVRAELVDSIITQGFGVIVAEKKVQRKQTATAKPTKETRDTK